MVVWTAFGQTTSSLAVQYLNFGAERLCPSTSLHSTPVGGSHCLTGAFRNFIYRILPKCVRLDCHLHTLGVQGSHHGISLFDRCLPGLCASHIARKCPPLLPSSHSRCSGVPSSSVFIFLMRAFLSQYLILMWSIS